MRNRGDFSMPRDRGARPRGADVYAKPALPEGELLARWEGRGLVLVDPDRAARHLRHIGYYRLSAYVRA